MKKVDLFLNIQINKVCGIVAIALISLFITACAGNKVSSDEAIDEPGNEYYRDSQQKWLASLKEGMSLEDALKPVLPYQNYFYKRKESGHLYQYIEGMFPKTGMLFGLFFEDGKLTNLLLDQSVYDFNNCRIAMLWDTKDFEKTVYWVRERNRLGGEYDDVSMEYKPDDSGGSGDVTEEIMYGILMAPLIPLALVGPFIPEDKTEYYTQPEHLYELYSQIKPGVTNGKDLIRILGKPTWKSKEYMEWVGPRIKAIFVDGTVHWIESQSYYWKYPTNNKIIFEHKNCSPTN